MRESRTLVLETSIKETLITYATENNITEESIDSIRGILPYGLSPIEMGDVGGQVLRGVEKINPSKDAVSNGLKAEVKAVLGIGALALESGDLMTAESAAHRLRNLHSVRGWIAHSSLTRELKKQFVTS